MLRTRQEVLSSQRRLLATVCRMASSGIQTKGRMANIESEPEHRTRHERVDPKLIAAGWQPVPFDALLQIRSYQHEAVREFPTQSGPADYALCADGKILGIVEAKKLSLGPQGVLTQAERYSRGVPENLFNFNGFRVPFLYSTNGEVIWFHDIRHPLNRSRRIAHFHTPSALLELLDENLDQALRWLSQNPNTHPLIRPYQVEADTAIEGAIAERKRLMLVAMATGTGKTFTLVNLIYRLMKSGLAKRILFMVDRRVLAAQAVREFASFEAEPGLKFDKIYEVYSQRFQREDFEDGKFDPKVLPTFYLTDPQPGHAFVYVSTIQRMTMNLFGREAAFALGDEPIEEDADRLDIPIHAFDVVIADECHRGYTTAEEAIWRKTLDHFDAIKIGLTATPAAHTKAYFKDIVYRYEYERAVREGYLVDYDVVTVKSGVRMNGVFLHQGDHIQVVDPETGLERMDELEDERQFDATEVERKITAPDSNRKIIEEVKKYADEHEQHYGRFPKTLIFAVNDLPHISHADQLVDLARYIFGHGDSFVEKITGRTDRPLQRIREFRNRPNPAVAITVDLMSTGVDIPDLEFIVFLRPVKSRILFEQMLGRGTRKGFRFLDKSHFTVFDCFDGTLLRYFREATAITAEPPERPTRSIKEVIEDIWNNRDRQYNVRCLVKRLQRIDKEMSGEAREMFRAFVADGDLARYARNLPSRLQSDFTNTVGLLRDPHFQGLMVTYPRPKRTFIVAPTVDEVSSAWLVRLLDGREYKPEDYIGAFNRFVRQNPAKIQAIEILLNRPRAWNTDALSQLRLKLATAPEQFTVENLEKAHRLHYHKALIDIISMVKRAARESEPLLTATERVDRAFQVITKGKQFTDQQNLWLNRLHDHLIVNLSVDKMDFEIAPILDRSGGWNKANRVFEGKLEDLIRSLNEAVAA